MPEELILVDSCNRAVGRAEKLRVHREGLRHRAFSIFLVDREGRLLLQQRSRAKYHSAGLWANSCCGHPRPGERTLQAARRRLAEELGATTRLRYAFRAAYRTSLPGGLTENEIVYVYFGPVPAQVDPNPAEVARVARQDLAKLEADIRRRPRRYAYWLRHYLKSHLPAVRTGVATLLHRGR
ncbi:MAG: isopentenyl-diphosphate Delta-isomerase [Verrucomicrobia bacterium]|jgi:isopentenyl-diphosphate delta-isomerase|nr:isopentenyl-diphosphate Delta-isomerase [Verrucomicrobiota bacterium]